MGVLDKINNISTHAIFLSARQTGKTAALKKCIAELAAKNKPFKKKKLNKF